MAAVAVQCIAEDVTRWISASTGGCSVVPTPLRLGRHSSSSSCNDVFVSYSAHSASDFARAVVARLRLERPQIRISIDSEDERRSLKAIASKQQSNAQGSGCVLVILTYDVFECPLVQQEIASCFVDELSNGRHPRLAFVYNVRSGRGQDPGRMVRDRAPSWLQMGLEKLSSPRRGSDSSRSGKAKRLPSVPIFEYIHEYDDLCVSALLKWLDGHDDSALPNSSLLTRLRSGVRGAAIALSSPLAAKALADEPKRTALPPITGSMTGSLSAGFSLSASAVSPSIPKGQKRVAVGFLFDPNGVGEAIARDAERACARAFGSTVRTADVAIPGGVSLDDVANLLIIVTQGIFRCDHVLQTVGKAIRQGGVNILMAQDVRGVPNIWDEFDALPPSVMPSLVSTIAIPYLQSHGFSACLARLAGTELLRPVACAESGNVSKPAAAQYGRSATMKIFDLFLCHFQRTGLDWAFAMRLGFVQHAGIGFRTFLDVQSLQNVNDVGRFVEQSHALAVLVTPGIFTRVFCQKELLFARRAGVQVILIQHMRSCIDMDEELELVRCSPAEFMASSHGAEYSRAGGTEADFANFQQTLFEQIWTGHFRPPVFAYIHELEASCIQEIVQYLRNRRARRTAGVEQLDKAARALLEFLRLAPEDRTEMHAGLSALANQAASGNGNEFCAALVRVNALPMVAEGLERHGNRDEGVARQALRSLRVAANTTSGQQALQQFAGAPGALKTLHQVIVTHLDKGCDKKMQSESLEVLRALRLGGPQLQLAILEAGLRTEFDSLFKRLRAELEPLDEIREQLHLPRVQLPQLEFALVNWKRMQGGDVSSLPAEVECASALLRNVGALRDAVSKEDGRSAGDLLREHVEDVERCADLEALLREARRLAKEFQENERLQRERLRSEEEFALAKRKAEDRLVELVSRAIDAPEPDLVKDLEDAIVLGHQFQTPVDTLEQAREVLDELRVIFESPASFLKRLEENDVQSSTISPFSAVLSLMVRSSTTREHVLQCLHIAKKLASTETSTPVLVKRFDVDHVHSVMQAFAQDIPMQVAACDCLTAFLQVTRTRHGCRSSKALVHNPHGGDSAVLQAVLATLSAQRENNKVDASMAESSLKCLAELCRCGKSVVTDMRNHQGAGHIFYVLHLLERKGRATHVLVVEAAILVFEEIARHGGRRSVDGVGMLLKCCDIYDHETTVCVPGLRSLAALFLEHPAWSGILAGTFDLEVDPLSPDAKRHDILDVGLGIVLRAMRVQDRQAAAQEFACTILGIMARWLLDERIPIESFPCHLLSKAVEYIVLAMRIHIGVGSVCSEAAVALANAMQFWEAPVCNDVVRAEGVAVIVSCMGKHTAEDKVQQNGLKMLSLITKYFPKQTLGETNLRAIVTAMRNKPKDAITQLFGCAALRTISEQGKEAAEGVGNMASETVFAALDSCPGHAPLHEEAFRAIELAAASQPQVGLLIGESYEAVLRITSSLRHLVIIPCRSIPGTCDMNRELWQKQDSTVGACLAACRAIRALCDARATFGSSFERVFHRGVCTSSNILVQVLASFPYARDLQMETLELLLEAVRPDRDGAMEVGRTLVSKNMLLFALQQFHTDSDCIVIFGLLSRLAVCQEFVASFVGLQGAMEEVLRWTTIFRDDKHVSRNAMELILAFLNSSAFDPSILLRLDGLEALMLAVSRHGDTMAKQVTDAVSLLASRSQGLSFYTTIKKILEKHVSNNHIVGWTCNLFCDVFNASADSKQAVIKLLKSGALQALLNGIRSHREDRNLLNRVPCFIDLVLRDDLSLRKFLLDHNVAQVLVDVLQGSFQESSRKQETGWLAEVNHATRRAERVLDCPVVVAAACRALERLMCPEHAPEVVSPDLVSLLLRVLAITSDDEVRRCVVSLLARIMHFAESNVSWMVCTGRVGAIPQHSISDIAQSVRRGFSAEMEGIRLWRNGNHLPAASKFQTALEAYNKVLTIGSNKELSKALGKGFADTLTKHLNDVPLAQFVQLCEAHHVLLQKATSAARSAPILAALEHEEECPICLEGVVLGGSVGIWTCGQCKKWMHEHCAAQWHERNATCPLCRKPMRGGEAVINAFSRTKAIAEAATQCLQAANQPVVSLRGEVHSAAFLALSVAALWRTAAQIGKSVGAPSSELSECDNNIAKFEANADVVQALIRDMEKFQTSFVQECEERARENQGDRRTMDTIVQLIHTMSSEVLQRRCAMLGEEAAIWETEVTRLVNHSRFNHADQLLSLFCGHLSDIIELANKGGLRSAGVKQRLDEAVQLRKELRPQRDARNEEDAGSYSAMHRERRPLLYLGNCFGRPWDRTSLHRHAIICMRSVLAAARTCNVMIANSSRAKAHTGALPGARRLVEEAAQVIQAMLQDRLHFQIASYLESDRSRHDRLLAIAFFEELQHCGEEARGSTFANIDAMFAALAHPRNAEDSELQSCLCSLIHNLIFRGGCEQRMANRLQRESSPRTATTLEEWFLDTLLVQSNASAFREQILQPREAEAWLCCGGDVALSDGLEAFFSVEG